jgi:3-dehydroquinate synthase
MTQVCPDRFSGPNVVLTGFMGTGKTTVGRAVARRLGRPFVDMDAAIEAQAGKSIPRIFAEDGEAAFRRIEARLCETLARLGQETFGEQEIFDEQGTFGEQETLGEQDGAWGEGGKVLGEGGKVLGEVSDRYPLVIATGGGALVDPTNRALMMEHGLVICLSCSVDEILRRVRQGAPDVTERPLLNVEDPRAEVQRLLDARRDAYRAIPWQIDTTALSIEEVVARVCEIADAKAIPVHYPGGDYTIFLGEGTLGHVGRLLRSVYDVGGAQSLSVAVVSNPTVAPLYSDRVMASLVEAGFDPFKCSIPDGEPHKTLATVADLYEQFLAGELDRSGIVLSLGGGVTGDIAGFAAATFMRGVRFVQVPTTLLAMVDASVGGKTGVDLPQGKNLVGAFKQPALVAIDPAVLATLPVEEFRSGMAEVIKHGIIGDRELFEMCEGGSVRDLAQQKVGGLFTKALQTEAASVLSSQSLILNSLLARALQVKIDVVEEDPFEHGQRAVLNLGHTAGHALERLSGFTLRHGQAVSIGIVVATHIAVALDMAEPALIERIEAALGRWGLPVRIPSAKAFDNVEVIWHAMAHDKKKRGRKLRWILPRAIGEVEIVENVPPELVKSVLKALRAVR